MYIESYSFGSMTVDGETYDKDLIIFPDKLKSGWWRKEGHSLTIEDLVDVVTYRPHTLIVGRGASSCMDVPASTKQALERQGIAVVEVSTYEAVELFNERIEEGEKVAGAFHLTC
ncbi:MAG: hypothetical protein JSW40_07010 [Candidatus Omnitrophota bacterium]|nr:MAG: hypothetical protein JSW40_07010 [Candidatus Omnitrophota bacterium]